MVASMPSSRAKLAAVTTLLLGLVFLSRLPQLADTAGYLAVLAGGVVVAGLLTGYRLWFGGHSESRLVAVTVAGLAFLGQVLNLLVGLPGARVLAGQIGLWGIAALMLEVLTVVVLVTDRDRRRAAPPARPPYAL